MKIVISVLVLVFSAIVVWSRASFTPQSEMISDAQVIAIVNIQSIVTPAGQYEAMTAAVERVRNNEPGSTRGLFPYQVAKGVVERVLKGEPRIEIAFCVPSFFPCAVTEVHKGRYIVFLRLADDMLEGNNWHYSYRPIVDGQVEWYEDGKGLKLMKAVSLGSVIEDITATVREQALFCSNTVWSCMSHGGSELSIPQSAAIADKDWMHLANNNGFRSLRSVAIHDRSVADVALKSLQHAPIEDLNLNGCSYSSDGLAELLDHLPRIGRLNIANTKFSDMELAHVHGTNLIKLVIYRTAVSDAGCATLTNFENLVHLTLTEECLTDDGYENLRHLTHLAELNLAGKRVTDDTIQYLRSLPLRELSIYKADISDKSMETIGKMRSLTSLALSGCKIGDTGIAHITSLDQLATIRLTSTLITDVAMSHLGQMKTLKSIELSSTGISDAGLAYLSDLPNLKYMDIKSTTVTKKGMQAFKEKCPSVSIIHDLK